MTESQGRTKQGVQSLEIGLGILEVVVRAQRPMRLIEIAHNASISPSKARMYLISLIRTGMVEQDPVSGTYRAGVGSERLGFMAMHGDGLLAAAQELVTSLGSETSDPVLLSRWDGDHSIIIFTSERSRTLPIEFRVGHTTNLLNTATGKTFLAHMASDVVAAALAAHGMTRPSEALKRELVAIRNEGYALSEEIYLQPGVTLTGFGAIAAPIFDISKGLRFVLTVIFRSVADRAAVKLLVEKVRAQSAALSKNYTPQP